MRVLARMFVPVAALAAVLAWAAPAAATSGEITRAEASADWTEGSIAGSVTWTGCERDIQWAEEAYARLLTEWEPLLVLIWPEAAPPYCGWIPFASVGPGSDPAECTTSARRRPDSLGAGVELAWKGPERRSGEGAEAFDVSGIALNGDPDQLVCLSLIEVAPGAVLCAAVVGLFCPPYWMFWFPHTLGSELMVAEPTSEVVPGPEPPADPEPEDGPPSSVPGLPPESETPQTEEGRTTAVPRVVYHRRHGHVRKK